MKVRQTILSWFYPFFIWLSKLTSRRSTVIKNENQIPPAESIYPLSIQLNNGQSLPLEAFKGKKLLLVNTASDCGYTRQYSELQNLYEKHKDHLLVIGFPANDFKEQEKGDDETIAEFCKINFGVTFPLAKKSSVIKSENQNNIFSWLSDKSRNGWLNKQPSWNFSKYLLNEEGMLTHYFDPAVSPEDPEVLQAVHQAK